MSQQFKIQLPLTTSFRYCIPKHSLLSSIALLRMKETEVGLWLSNNNPQSRVPHNRSCSPSCFLGKPHPHWAVAATPNSPMWLFQNLRLGNLGWFTATVYWAGRSLVAKMSFSDWELEMNKPGTAWRFYLASKQDVFKSDHRHLGPSTDAHWRGGIVLVCTEFPKLDRFCPIFSSAACPWGDLGWELGCPCPLYCLPCVMRIVCL